MTDPTVGRAVHFGEMVGDQVVARAATVVGVGPNDSNGIVNLFVMTPSSTYHRIGVRYSSTLKANTWSWPVRVPELATGGVTTGEPVALIGDTPSGTEHITPLDSNGDPRD